MSSRRREHGFITVEFVLGVALFLIPVGILVISLPHWPARQATARAAASEAARSAVQHTDMAQATAAAQEAARLAATNHGLDPADVELLPLVGSVARNGTITVRVNVRMPAVAIPGLASAGEWTWTAEHTEAVDRYRSYP
jgi:Flp pilus assembly protein TadG